MHTQVCVVGTVATDPKLTKSAGRAAFCSFRLACNERRFDAEKNEWVDSDTNWYTVNSFRGLADHAVASFAKGDRVIIAGRLRVRDWTSGEKSGTSTIVEAEALGHDLRWGTSVFTKTPVTQSAEAADQQLAAEAGALTTSASGGTWGDRASTGSNESTEGRVDDASGSDVPDADAVVEGTLGSDGFTPKPEFSAV